MKGKNSRQIRIDPADGLKMEKFAAKRVIEGRDMKPASIGRIIKAILRLPNIEDSVTKAPFREK